MMQKKLMKRNGLTVAVLAAAMALPVSALADTANVTVYGVADMSYDITKNGIVGANKVSSNVSKMGLKGVEDMDGGLKALWQIESTINMDGTGTSTLGTRNTYLGLASDSIGKVIAGRHDTPYKLATRKLDVFADSIADNRVLMGSTRGNAGTKHDLRPTDVIAYFSPSMNGLSVSAAYIANAEGVTTAAQTKGSAYSLAAMYENAGINAAFAYQAITAGTAGTAGIAPTGLAANDKASAWKVGGGYTMAAINVNAAYEKTNNTIAATPAAPGKQTNIYLSGKYSFGNDAVKLAYTMAGKIDNAANTDATHLSVGYDHSLSKRTSVYAIYTQVNNKSGASYGLGNQTTGAITQATTGLKLSAFSFGMKHFF